MLQVSASLKGQFTAVAIESQLGWRILAFLVMIEESRFAVRDVIAFGAGERSKIDVALDYVFPQLNGTFTIDLAVLTLYPAVVAMRLLQVFNQVCFGPER